MKKKIHKLVAEPDEKFSVIGIVSHENDYRLSWAFNQYLGMKFVKSADLLVEQPKLEENPVFSVYKCIDDECPAVYYLISNKSENGFLLPEHKTVDFILKVTGGVEKSDLNDLLNKIKKLEFVSTAYVIENLSLKAAKNLIL